MLFWQALLGLAPQPVFDLPDPFGLIQSKAMTDPNGSLRLTFNISESRDTVTNRFVSAFADAGVHHIALRTDDAEATMRVLREHQAPTLDIPPNYYEDVASRLPLPTKALSVMEGLGILYDANADGEFLHGYTETFKQRFFFEVVERRRGYAGFGAANAAVRIAAQARRYVPTW